MFLTGKKNIALLFIILSSLPWAFVLFFYVNEMRIKHEMKEKIEAAMEMRQLTLHKNQFQWIKKNNEIIVSGKMFDVKNWQQQGNKFHFTGLYDEDETKLADEVNHHFPTDSRQNQLITRIFFLLVYISSTEKIPVWQADEFVKRHHIIRLGQIREAYLPVITPPPQYC